MATVPASRHQSRHSSPDLSRLSTATFKHHRHQNNLPPVPASGPLFTSPPCSDASTHQQNLQEGLVPSYSITSAPMRVPTEPLSPISPTSAELRVQTTNLPSASRPVVMSKRPSAAILSQSNSYETSPGSTSSSPGMDSIPKLTPLPSPIIRGGSPGPWGRLRSKSVTRPVSRSSLSVYNSSESVFVTSTGESLSSALAAQSQRMACQSLAPAGAAAMVTHQNNTVRTPAIDEFNKTVSLQVPSIPRTVIVPVVKDVSDAAATATTRDAGTAKTTTDMPQPTTTTTKNLTTSSSPTCIRREECLAKQRHETPVSLESSPSITGISSSSSTSSTGTAATSINEDIRVVRRSRLVEFEAFTVPENDIKRWRGLRLLGQGTFSKVILATSEPIDHTDLQNHHVGSSLPNEDGTDEEMMDEDEQQTETEIERILDPKSLVAVKIVENGAAGGASRDRVESSLKRELDILKSVEHPSLVRLKAFSIQRSRALLVLPYCPGGDLFNLASEYRELLTPPLIRRLFSELLGAVRYLHNNGIVHRDVKLENVLMNLTPSQITALPHPPFDHPHPIITLTDLGLSRRVDFASEPLLQTRCGSEDYASPELLMGQPYDGRQTDAWALGVLLYALMEGRLPFDPPPGAEHSHRMRSRTAHRIARCEWKWVNLVEENGKGGYDLELQGGKEIVNGLLKTVRKRVGLDVVETDAWVVEAVEVALAREEEDDGSD